MKLTTTITDKERDKMLAEIEEKIEYLKRDWEEKISEIDEAYEKDFRRLLERKLMIYDVWRKGQIEK